MAKVFERIFYDQLYTYLQKSTISSVNINRTFLLFTQLSRLSLRPRTLRHTTLTSTAVKSMPLFLRSKRPSTQLTKRSFNRQAIAAYMETHTNGLSYIQRIVLKWRGVGAYQKPQNRAKNRWKPKNRKKFRPQLKTEIKALTDKALVGFRISLLFNFSTSKLVLLAKVLSAYSLVPRQYRTHCSLKICYCFCKLAQQTYSQCEARIKLCNKMIVGVFCVKKTTIF